MLEACGDRLPLPAPMRSFRGQQAIAECRPQHLASDLALVEAGGVLDERLLDQRRVADVKALPSGDAGQNETLAEDLRR